MVIYKIEDRKTRKSYIGKTVRSFKKRKQEHLQLLETGNHYNKYLQRIFNRDRSRLVFSIVQVASTLEELNLLEIYWISEGGKLNNTLGGDGGDTMSMHPNKRDIYLERSRKYTVLKGEKNCNYKHLTKEQEETIIGVWNELKIPTLKGVSKKTEISTYLCKRCLRAAGIDIKNRNETLNALRVQGLLKGSRDPNFNKKEVDYIKKRYIEDWIGCRTIALELGFKSESPILKVIKNLGLLRTQSEWSTRNNLNRKYGDTYK